MRFVKLISIITLITTLIATTSLAQDVQVQKSTEKVRIGGGVYYVHNVKKGETIYSLTKIYGISEADLVQTNPLLADGLKEGQVLRIPENPTQASTQQKAAVKPDGTIEHEVQRKETLYSISRQYNTSVDAIKKANPTIDDNINKGQILYIPVGQSNVSQQSSTTLADSQQHVFVPIRHESNGDDDMAGEHVYHSVKKGETLYSIAHQYDTDESVVRSLNPDAFKNGALLDGAVLRIPKYEPSDLDSGTKILFPGYTYQPSDIPTPVNTYRYNQDRFNVAFLLPISSKNDNASLPEPSNSTSTRKVNSYLEFYEGALLAIDSLKHAGLSLNISTFDIADSKSLSTALQSSGVQEAQLIIAPVQTDLAGQLASYAQQRQIPVVLPVSTLSDSLISYNPYLIQLRTSPSTVNHKLLDNICKADRNIILVGHAGRDTILFHTYNTILKEAGCTYSTLSYTIAKSRSTLQSKLSTTKENHIVVASFSDQSFVMDVLETLNVSFSKNKIVSYVYGSPEWRKMSMNNLQLTYLYNLNLHLVQPFFICYNDTNTKNFIAKYRYYYKGEPSNYSFYGYDVCCYFIDCLKTYGENFIPFLPSNKKQLLQSNFLFKQPGYGGMKNEGVFLLEYQPSIDIIRQ